jgi:hypothetical protein
MNASVQILTQALHVPARVPQEGRAKVIQLGPSLKVRGGVTSVEQLICDYLSPYVAVKHVATMDEGSVLTKAAVFAGALRMLRGALQSTEPAIFHVHFASRGSTLRKMILAEMIANAGRPLILHAHGARFDSFHRGLPKILRRRVNATLQRATMFIALSQQWRQFFVDECELSPSQVTVLPNPVRWQPEVPNRAGRTHVQFVSLGRLSDRKGSYDLVNAFASCWPATGTSTACANSRRRSATRCACCRGSGPPSAIACSPRATCSRCPRRPKGCRWRCSRPWPPACRPSPRRSAAFPMCSPMARRGCWCSPDASTSCRPR